MEKKKIIDLFAEEGVQYRVPIYHRYYVWQEKNWERLWNDIIEQTERRLQNKPVKSHFMGFIVIHKENKTREIVDGQQRLTTFQIILCAIQRFCRDSENLHENIDKRVNSLIFNDTANLSDPNEQYKLLPCEKVDRKAFQIIVADENYNSENKVYRAYRYFVNKIFVYIRDNDNLMNLFESVLNDFVVIETTVDSDDDPEHIFQNINGTSVLLNEFEDLKSNLFYRADTPMRDELYRKYWCYFEEDPFWDKREEQEHFLESFIMSKRSNYIYFYDYSDIGWDNRRISKANLFSLPNDKYKSELRRFKREKPHFFVEYQDYRKGLWEKLGMDRDDPQLIIHEFRELKKYARCYREIRDRNTDIGYRLTFYDDEKNANAKRYIPDNFENQMKY